MTSSHAGARAQPGLDTLRTITTPEGVELNLRLAGPMPRACAWAIDFVLRAAILLAVVVAVSALGQLGLGIFLISAFLLEWIFPAVCEVHFDGATPGKKAMGLRVVNDDGTPVQVAAAVVRNLLRAVDFLPVMYGVGLASMLVNREFKRLGDLVAQTVVVYREEAQPASAIPQAAAIAPATPLSMEEARAILDYAERAPDLTAERAEELALIGEPLVGGAVPAAAGSRERMLGVANYIVGRGRAMKQQLFEDRYGAEWAALEAWLARRGKRQEGAAATAFSESELPQRYRRLCQQLALARDRRYGTQVVERLHRLASEIHQVLYGARGDERSRWLIYLYGGFARAVRLEWRVVLAATLLFFIPFTATNVLAQLVPEAALYVLGPEQIGHFEEMYGKGAEHLGRRGADSDFAMFGFYIFNNVKIAFQMFAGGLAAGLGTLFYLLFNGVTLGTAAGYVTGAGHGESFYSFVAGHSAFELTGVVLAGAAGLKIGLALVAPGRLTRRHALAAAGRDAAAIMYGAAALLFAAAFVEAFWSPRTTVAPLVKYGVGIAAWLLVLAYFALGGRRRGA
jgi:uncharacterized membrane protein SpoIIM required for sporulation/uncharacterized RDD family membrane protein YckC